MNMQFVYDVPDQEIGTSTTPPSTAHLAASCADHVLSHILYVGDEVLISISGAKSRAALMEWLDVHTEIEWQQLSENALSELGVPLTPIRGAARTPADGEGARAAPPVRARDHDDC